MAEAATKRRAADNKKAPRKPKWPLLQPKLNLHITRLKNHDLFTVQNFFSPAESKALIKAAESTGFEHQGSLGPAKGEAYRDNDRISINDPALADMVAPAEGMALLHIHGDKCMLHEARNVSKGIKYVFRSDVVFA